MCPWTKTWEMPRPPLAPLLRLRPAPSPPRIHRYPLHGQRLTDTVTAAPLLLMEHSSLLPPAFTAADNSHRLPGQLTTNYHSNNSSNNGSSSTTHSHHERSSQTQMLGVVRPKLACIRHLTTSDRMAASSDQQRRQRQRGARAAFMHAGLAASGPCFRSKWLHNDRYCVYQFCAANESVWVMPACWMPAKTNAIPHIASHWCCATARQYRFLNTIIIEHDYASWLLNFSINFCCSAATRSNDSYSCVNLHSHVGSMCVAATVTNLWSSAFFSRMSACNSCFFLSRFSFSVSIMLRCPIACRQMRVGGSHA